MKTFNQFLAGLSHVRRGQTLFDKAAGYLAETDPLFRALPEHVKHEKVNYLVRAHLGLASNASDTGSTAISKLNDAINSDTFRGLLEAAAKENQELCIAIIGELLARAEKKPAGEVSTVSASAHALNGYPGRNEIEKAQSYLLANLPIFKSYDRQTQVRLAAQYSRNLEKSGAAVADRVLFQAIGVTS